METKIDKFGRIVIPKPARDALALEAGDELELEVREEDSGSRTIWIRPLKHSSPFKRKGKVLVFTGKLTEADLDIVEHIKTSRDERTRKISGLE